MRILFITPYVPSRIRVRPFQTIKELAKRHEVHVVALDESDGTSTVGLDEIRNSAADVVIVPHSKTKGLAQALVALPLPIPLSAAYCWSRQARTAVSQKISNAGFDLIHIEHLRAAHFAPSGRGVATVFDAVDCLTGLFRQMARSKKNPLARAVMRLEAAKLAYYEPRILRRFDRVVATSDSERTALMTLNPSVRVEVVPNGVDTDYFSPKAERKVPRRIIFSGKMSYSPNAQAAIWFAREVFPRVRAEWHDAEFVIAGSNPPDEVKMLSAVPGIRVTGYLEDLRPELDAASVAVAPMQTAVGIQNKVLEAMSMALPVVASSLAVRPIGRDAPGIIEANTPEEAAAALGRLFRSPEEITRLGLEGREFVKKFFSWPAAVEKLEAIYNEALARRS
ncbi:MAG: glycosyltransferase [Armatimonadota bacterium]|nr:glycosyltransferase [Armatimonadota bacterium]